MSAGHLTVAEAQSLAEAVLTSAGTRPAAAKSVAHALVLAECDGQSGHGLSRLIPYAEQVTSGKVDGTVEPVVTQPRPATVYIDAACGFAFPAIDAALPELVRIAPEQGLAAAALARSHHFGVAGHPVERLARNGLIALAFSNSPAAIAPWGGHRPLYGTNPIAFAVPRAQGEPVVVDLSLSKVARGKVMVAAQRDEAIPEGWAVDADGRPTADADAALAGSMLPAGDAKGAALAFMVEVLSVALTGSHFGFQASSFFVAEGNPPAIGQLLVAIDPGGFGYEGTHAQIETLLGAMTAQEGVRLPGARRFELRAAAERDGLIVDGDLLARLRART